MNPKPILAACLSIALFGHNAMAQKDEAKEQPALNFGAVPENVMRSIQDIDSGNESSAASDKF